MELKIPTTDGGEDISGFLLAEGIDGISLSLVNEQRADNSATVPTIPGSDIYRYMNGNEPPEDIEPLALSPKLSRMLEEPITTAKGVHDTRRTLIGEIREKQQHTTGELNLTEENVDDLALVVAEAFTNGVRHGGGVRRMQLGRTAAGNLVWRVENLALNFPENTFIRNTDGRLVRIGHVANKNAVATPAASDEHDRGLYLIAKTSANEARQDLPVTAGIYDEDIMTIPRLNADNSPADPPTAAIRTTSVWGECGTHKTQYGQAA